MALGLALLSSCSREEAREETAAPGRDPKPVRVLFQTELGDVEIEVDTGRAPVTAGNFLKYLDAGRYNGGRFHRTVKLDNQPDSAVKIEVIQGGINPAEEGQKLPAIPLERTDVTGILHKDGTISMARAAPDSATSDFFLCIGDQPALDFGGQRNPDGQGFAAFGRVVKGMEAVKKIQQAKSQGQTLTPPIGILKAARL